MRAGFLGAGHIARALAEGWRRDAPQAPSGAAASRRGASDLALGVYDPLPEPAQTFAARFDARVSASPAALVSLSEIVVLAMRPTDVPAALAAVAPVLEGRALVSLAAAVPLGELRAGLPDEACVARLMPNVAAAVGRGVFLLAAGTLTTAQLAAVRDLFGRAGTVVEIPESLFDAATAVSGCGPGFTALFIEALAEAGVKAGLSEELARELAVAGVAGSAALVARDGDPVAVRTAVATPGGMTAEGVEVLEDRGLREALAAAVAAAVARAERGR
jgi:pyrroline-5-carboxylate reductase